GLGRRGEQRDDAHGRGRGGETKAFGVEARALARPRRTSDMATTTGTYRVLGSPHDPAEVLLLDVETGDPTYVPKVDYEGDLAERVADLDAGNRIAAQIAWN